MQSRAVQKRNHAGAHRGVPLLFLGGGEMSGLLLRPDKLPEHAITMGGDLSGERLAM